MLPALLANVAFPELKQTGVKQVKAKLEDLKVHGHGNSSSPVPIIHNSGVTRADVPVTVTDIVNRRLLEYTHRWWLQQQDLEGRDEKQVGSQEQEMKEGAHQHGMERQQRNKVSLVHMLRALVRKGGEGGLDVISKGGEAAINGIPQQTATGTDVGLATLRVLTAVQEAVAMSEADRWERNTRKKKKKGKYRLGLCH